ncbi:Alpha/Beta hydrolase protein [Globomyces pollinis-pini]|nr:Alpha/Beta hydrolase protein [Globomyces pollinis-pini]
MNSLKCDKLMNYVQENGTNLLLFDHFGHGKSSGSLLDGTIGKWSAHLNLLIEHVIPQENPILLIGSSMGSWISILCSVKLIEQNRLHGFIGLNSAVNFTTTVWNSMDEDTKHQFKRNGFISKPSRYSNSPYQYSYSLVMESFQHKIDPSKHHLRDSRVELIHGLQDLDIHYTESIELMKLIGGENTRLSLVNGNHRFSSEREWSYLESSIDRLL